jgi:hypothetical protein
VKLMPSAQRLGRKQTLLDGAERLGRFFEDGGRDGMAGMSVDCTEGTVAGNRFANEWAQKLLVCPQQCWYSLVGGVVVEFLFPS